MNAVLIALGITAALAWILWVAWMLERGGEK